MSLAALAVVGREGTPLYLRDYVDESDLLFDACGRPDDRGADAFGDGPASVAGETARQADEWPCRPRYQFALHSACERMGDVLRENQWRTPGATGMDACWVGLLCLLDNFRAYGYATTNAKYVAIVEDSIAPENSQLQNSRDHDVCVVLANIHRLYTESLMNPFTSPHAKIISKRFDLGVSGLVEGFNGR